LVSGTSEVTLVEVQVLSSAPRLIQAKRRCKSAASFCLPSHFLSGCCMEHYYFARLAMVDWLRYYIMRGVNMKNRVAKYSLASVVSAVMVVASGIFGLVPAGAAASTTSNTRVF